MVQAAFGLTHSHTMAPFDESGKRRTACTSNFSYSYNFSTLSKTYIIIFVTFNLSSANAFNLVWSKIVVWEWDCWFNNLLGSLHFLTLKKKKRMQTTAGLKQNGCAIQKLYYKSWPRFRINLILAKKNGFCIQKLYYNLNLGLDLE